MSNDKGNDNKNNTLHEYIYECAEKESLMVGDNIKVTIIKIRDKVQVRIGVKAPEQLKILRSEYQDTDPDKK